MKPIHTEVLSIHPSARPDAVRSHRPPSVPFMRRLPRWIAVVMVLTLAWLPGDPHRQRSVYAQADAAAVQANGWSFVDVVRVGQHGFTQLVTGRAGADGAVVYGERNAETGLFRVKDGTVTEVVTDGAVLPDGLGTLGDVAAFGYQFAVLPNGDVIFQARATEGTLSPSFFYTFRWRAGTISLMQPSEEFDPDTFGQAFEHYLTQVTSDNRWLISLRSGAFPNTTTAYALTDGEPPTQPLLSFTNSSAGCVTNNAPLVAANANGVAAVYEVQTTRSSVGALCQDPTQQVWSVKLAGASTGTLAGSSSFKEGNTQTGNDLSTSSLFLLNAQYQVAAVRQIFNSPTTFVPRRQLVLFAGGSETILQDTDGPASDIFLVDLDDTGRVLYSVALDNSLTTVLLAGPDLEADRVLRTGDPLFDKTVTALSWVTRPAAVGADIVDGFAFQYALDDGAVGIALASKSIPRWINPAGGDWGTAGNWLPVAVPGAADAVRFDLDAAYTVNVGTRRIAGVSVRDGDVTFRSGELEVTNDGSIDVSGVDAGTVARLTIGQAGAAERDPSIVANIGVGFNGPGELRIANAMVATPDAGETPGSVMLGLTAPATATVTAGALWSWGIMRAGLAQDVLVRVEDGALAGFASDELWIGSHPLDPALRNRTATVIVDNATNHLGPVGFGTTLGLATELVVGDTMIGKLEVRNGARTVAVTTTVGTRDHGARTDGYLTVDGTNADLPARFISGNLNGSHGGLFVATGAKTDALVTVSSGGIMTVTRLSLADGAQSNVLMFVDGMEPADGGERRSALYAPLSDLVPVPAPRPTAAAASADNGTCVIGRAGSGTLNVSNGGLVHCRQIAVGLLPGSRGEVNIGGAFRSVNPRVVAAGSAAGDGTICIGRIATCGATTGTVRGDVVLGADGILEGVAILMGPGGRIRGTGTLIATEGVALLGGSIAPGIAQIEGAQTAAVAAPAAPESVGTLTIQGNLTVSETGVISLTVLGQTAGLQDRLVVSGTLRLDGTLALEFGNGYAPKTGDTLALIQAAGLTGAPQTVVITGLAAGFAYDVTVQAGALQLTALNDGVPTTTAPAERFGLLLPSLSR